MPTFPRHTVSSRPQFDVYNARGSESLGSAIGSRLVISFFTPKSQTTATGRLASRGQAGMSNFYFNLRFHPGFVATNPTIGTINMIHKMPMLPSAAPSVGAQGLQYNGSDGSITLAAMIANGAEKFSHTFAFLGTASGPGLPAASGAYSVAPAGGYGQTIILQTTATLTTPANPFVFVIYAWRG